MKKFRFLFLCGLLCTAVSVSAQTWSNIGANGSSVTAKLSGGTLTISGTGAMANHSSSGNTIPWYYYRNAITTVVINAGVTTIGNAAFAYCTNLSSITIPNSVTSIGNEAFINCSSLTSVSIHNQITSIGAVAFYGCSLLTSIAIPKSVTTIGGNQYVGVQTFFGCSTLAAINVAADNDTYSSIDGVLFNKNKTNLIAYPGGKHGAYAIPGGVTTIDKSAFRGCGGLTSVAIPNSVSSISDYAFYGCTNLSSIAIPNNVDFVGWYAFYDCTSLTSMAMGSGVATIGANTFGNCSALTTVAVGNSVTAINHEAFGNCTELTSVTMGSSVDTISIYAFWGCNKLAAIEVAASNVHYTSADGVLFSKDGATLVMYPRGKQSAYTIPNTVNTIGSYAFYGCLVPAVTIPDNATTINKFAFIGCTGLSSVTIGKGVTTIEEGAFWTCSGLTSVICLSPTPPTFFEEDHVSRDSAFHPLDLATCRLYVPQASLTLYQNAHLWKYFDIHTLSSNSALASLSLSNGIALSPAFDAAVTTYTAVVPNSVSTATITAVAEDANATVAVTARSMRTAKVSADEKMLNVGDNIFDVVVTAQDGTTTTYVLTATRQAPTRITQAPNDTAVCEAQPLTLTLNAVYSDSIAWFRNGIKVSIGNSLVFNHITHADSGRYYAVAYGSNNDTSELIRVGVLAPLTVILHLTADTVATCEGSNVELTYEVANAAAYRWYKDDVLLANTGGRLVVTSPTLAAAGMYVAQASNSCGFVNDSIIVKVLPQAKIAQVSNDTAVREGEALTLTANATSSDSVVWYRNNSRIYNGNNLIFSSIEIIDSGSYYAVAYNSCNIDTSEFVQVAVAPQALTSVANMFGANLKIYPNPFVGTLQLSGAEGCTLRVVNQNGVVVHIQQVASAEEVIQVAHLSAGVYFFCLEKDSQVMTVKAVKK